MILKQYVCSALLFCLVSLLAMPAAAQEAISMEHQLGGGYLGVRTNGNAGNAREFDELTSSPTVNLDFMGNYGHKHLFIEGEYKGTNDYRVDSHVDLDGAVLLNLSSERFWHQLNGISYADRFNGDFSAETMRDPDGVPNSGDEVADKTRVTVPTTDPADEYGLRLQFDEAAAIVKLGDSPAHLRLKYWRQTKQGKQQLRFLEEGAGAAAGDCTSCHLQTKTRQIKRVTDELTASVDAHIGPVDLVFEQMARFYTVKDPIPTDAYLGHSRFGPLTTTDFQHDEDPESRLLQTTIKARTSLTGGFVADAAYTLGMRDNLSDLNPSSGGGVDDVYAESTYQKLAGDVSYMPATELTLNFRFRFLDVETRNSSQVSTGDTLQAYTRGATTYSEISIPPVTFNVRDNMNVNRTSLAASANWRANKKVTFKADVEREIILRGQTGDTPMLSGSISAVGREADDYDPDWSLPSREIIDQVKLGVISRPLGHRALRVSSWYRYKHSTDPAYGTSFENRHEGFFGANYSGKGYWGVNASTRLQRDDNDQLEHEGVPGKRQRNQFNGDVGLWLTPAKQLTAGINYGYLTSRIRQDVVFGANTALIPPNIARYTIDSHTVSAHATWQLLDSLSLRSEAYYLQSQAEFTPQYFYQVLVNSAISPVPPYTGDLIISSEGLTEISRLDIRQQGISAGIDWEPTSAWQVSVDYGFDLYDDLNGHLEDGSVQSLMASLACRW